MLAAMLDSESALGVSLVMVLLLVSASGDVVASLAFELVRSERINEFGACEAKSSVVWGTAGDPRAVEPDRSSSSSS